MKKLAASAFVLSLMSSVALAADPVKIGFLSTFSGPSGQLGQELLDGFNLALEENGNICVATLVTGGITVFSPEGEKLEYWEGPEPYCTNICFGGPDMKTAWITVSGHGLLIAVDWPRPGLKLAF